MRSSTLHGSKTWLVKEQNQIELQQAKIRTIKWMCRVKVTDMFTCKQSRERLGTDYIIRGAEK